MKKSIFHILLIVITSGVLTMNAHCGEPSELSKLRSQWLSARTKAVSPIDKKYILSLEELKSRFTKAGNLDAALAVVGELKVVQDAGIALNPSAQRQTKAPTGTWKGVWQTGAKILTTVDKDGNIKDSGGIRTPEYSDSGWLVKMKDKDAVNRFTIIGDRMYTEQWWPFQLYKDGKPPSGFGYAIKIE